MDTFWFALTLIAALGSGLIGGVFFGFSTFIMKALGRQPARQGIAAMQEINIVVLNPWFMTPFLGMTAVGLALAIARALNLSDPESIWLIAGGLLYVVGTILVTGAFNVPLNVRLDGLDPDEPESEAVWKDFLPSWTFWNTVRTIAAMAASAAFIVALVEM